jgi:hypothetical protein
MKYCILVLSLLPRLCLALDPIQLNQLLNSAAIARDDAYVEARRAIIDLGSDALPLLANSAIDGALSWQQRLTARICYERIRRAKDIEDLRLYDWKTHPSYDKQWEMNILGPGYAMGKIVVPRMVESGLWYYYIEVNWKFTREYSYTAPLFGSLKDGWADWCIMALKKQPEHYYLIQALTERLTIDEKLSDKPNLNYYRYLLERKQPDAVPVLVDRMEAFLKRTSPPNLTPEEINKGLAYRLKEIFAFADSRHIQILEKFIERRLPLTQLKGKLDDIQKRATALSPVEPAFRLNHQAPIASH